MDDKPIIPPPPYALYDPTGKCWLGNDDGVRTFDNWDDARIAAAIATEQLGRTKLRELIRPAHYDGRANKLKDEVPTKMTPVAALQLLEAGKGFPLAHK
jgi:hypothetical protein